MKIILTIQAILNYLYNNLIDLVWAKKIKFEDDTEIDTKPLNLLDIKTLNQALTEKNWCCISGYKELEKNQIPTLYNYIKNGIDYPTKTIDSSLAITTSISSNLFGFFGNYAYYIAPNPNDNNEDTLYIGLISDIANCENWQPVIRCSQTGRAIVGNNIVVFSTQDYGYIIVNKSNGQLIGTVLTDYITANILNYSPNDNCFYFQDSGKYYSFPDTTVLTDITATLVVDFTNAPAGDEIKYILKRNGNQYIYVYSMNMFGSNLMKGSTFDYNTDQIITSNYYLNNLGTIRGWYQGISSDGNLIGLGSYDLQIYKTNINTGVATKIGSIPYNAHSFTFSTDYDAVWTPDPLPNGFSINDNCICITVSRTNQDSSVQEYISFYYDGNSWNYLDNQPNYNYIGDYPTHNIILYYDSGYLAYNTSTPIAETLTDSYVIDGNTVDVNYRLYNDIKICIRDYDVNDSALEEVYQYLGYLNYWAIDTTNEKLSLIRNSNFYTYLYVGDNYIDNSINEGKYSAFATKDEIKNISGDSLPDQTGNAGKFLTTDGTNPSWATVSGGDLSKINNYTGMTVSSDYVLSIPLDSYDDRLYFTPKDNIQDIFNADKWKIKIKLKYDSTNAGYGTFATMGTAPLQSSIDYQGFSFGIENGDICLFISSDGNGWDIASYPTTDTQLQLNQDDIYEFILEFTGNGYYLYGKNETDSGYTLLQYVQSSTKIGTSDNSNATIIFANNGYTGNDYQIFGDWYLKDCFVELNDTRYNLTMQFNDLKKAENVVDSNASVTLNIDSNKNYKLTNNAITDITIDDCENSDEETTIQFTTGSSAPTLTDNSGLVWFGGIPMLLANTTYVIVIFNKQAFYQEN